MGILFRKKKIYYLLCILAVLLICMAGDMIMINEKPYSVFRVIWESPKEVSDMCDMKRAFNAGVSSYWISLLLPVVSIPFASWLSDERKSSMYLYVKGRQGSFRYLQTKLCSAFASSAAVLLFGTGIYIVVIACYFPLNTSYDIVGAEVTAWGLCGHMAARMAYLLVYGWALSMLTGLFVYLYNDLCVDFCLVFLVNYFFRRCFEVDSFLWVFLMMAVTAALYMVARRIRRSWL